MSMTTKNTVIQFERMNTINAIKSIRGADRDSADQSADFAMMSPVAAMTLAIPASLMIGSQAGIIAGIQSGVPLLNAF